MGGFRLSHTCRTQDRTSDLAGCASCQVQCVAPPSVSMRKERAIWRDRRGNRDRPILAILAILVTHSLPTGMGTGLD
jgi:hypothetical protein